MMPQDRRQSDEFTQPLRRIFQAVIILCLLAIFLVWRIDSPRVERFRSHLIDRVIPSFAWAMTPVMAVTELALNFQSYQSLYEQNQELRRNARPRRRVVQGGRPLAVLRADMCHDAHTDDTLRRLLGKRQAMSTL